MFEIAWSKLMLIGVVALIVIGPKDLPAVLRSLGEAIGKLRRMADEFRGQFNEAMREAELDGLKKDITDLGDSVRSATSADFNPINTIREEIKGAVEAKQGSAQATASPSAATTLQPLTDEESRKLEIKMMEERLAQLKAEEHLTALPLPEPAPAPDFSAPDVASANLSPAVVSASPVEAQVAGVEALPDPARPSGRKKSAAKTAEKGAA